MPARGPGDVVVEAEMTCYCEPLSGPTGMVSLALVLALCAWPGAASGTATTKLKSGWQLASSAHIGDGLTGAELSQPGYDGSGWIALETFPTTVLAALDAAGDAAKGVAAGEIFFSQNFDTVETARFDVPWWYRVDLPASATAAAKDGGLALLTFEGLNYRANIWVNGKLLATNTTVAGAYRYFDVDATAALASGKQAGGALAIEVFRSYDWGLDCQNGKASTNDQASCRGRNKTEAQDLAITWVDWAPAAHDANMGLWRDVVLTTSTASASASSAAFPAASAAAVTCRYPGVNTKLSADNTAAEVEIIAECHNWGQSELSGSFQVELGQLGKAQATVQLAAGQVPTIMLHHQPTFLDCRLSV